MGFEAADIIKGIKSLIKQIKGHENKVEIEYKRAVNKKGNKTAQGVLDTVFRRADVEWRGLGVIPKSGLKFRDKFKDFDGEKEFKMKIAKHKKIRGCICGEVLQGLKAPRDCKMLGTACTPSKPIGPCMVSSEGSCAAYYKYER